VDAKSGVSARLTISAYEALVAAAERRALLNGEKKATIRISDFVGVVPSITGKVELVYEGEQEGPAIVAQNLVGKAIRSQFLLYFPDPDKFRKHKEKSPYRKVTQWFSDGNTLDLLAEISNNEYEKQLRSVSGLLELVNEFQKDHDPATKLLLMEFALHGLAEYSLLSKHHLERGLQFKDLISGMLNMPGGEEEDTDEDEDTFGNRSN
jgi:magnesium chelatase subunit I